MYQISRTHLIGYLVEDGITSSVHAKHTFSRTSIMLRFAFCFRSCIILVRTPPLGTKGGWREGRDPPGLLRRQPHASIRKLESTPTPTGDVEILTPAGHTKEDSNTCKGNNPYAYLCTDTYKKYSRNTRTPPRMYKANAIPRINLSPTISDCAHFRADAVSYTHLTLPTKA